MTRKDKAEFVGHPIDPGFVEMQEEPAFLNNHCSFSLFEHFHFKKLQDAAATHLKSSKVGLDDIAEAVSMFLLWNVMTPVLLLLSLAFSCAATNSRSHHCPD